MYGIEPKIVEHYTKSDNDLKKKTVANGVSLITFSEADSKNYVSSAGKALWIRLEKTNLELYTKLRQMSSSK